MKVLVKIEDVMLLGVSEEKYTSKKTQQLVTYYDLAFKQGAQVGSVSTVREIFDMYKNGQIKDMQQCTMFAEFNTDFRNMQVVAVHPVGK